MPELLLPRLKRDIHARLAELRPLVAEAAQLEAAKRALLDEHAAAAVPPPRRTPPARSIPPVAPRPAANVTSNGSEGSGRAPRGANQEAILALVEERPGVSVAEIASVTKIAKPTVASTVSKLKREGVLADEAGGVKLASRRPVTLAGAAGAPGRDEGTSDEEWDKARPRSGAAA
jgi:hypothetical protein